MPTSANEKVDANADVPRLMAHGTYDPVIPISLGLKTRGALMKLGYDVKLT
jgi:predicted esterase